MSTLNDAYESARLVELFHETIVLASFRASMMKTSHFASQSISLREVFGETTRIRSDIARRFGQRGAEIDWKTHLAATHESKRSELR